jgi:Acyl carrier protein
MDTVMEFKEIAAQYCEIAAEDMTDSMRLREDLGLSSLDFMSFLGELEDSFDIELDQDEAVHVQTIGDAIDMIHALQEA